MNNNRNSSPQGEPFKVFHEDKVPDLLGMLCGGPFGQKLTQNRVKHIVEVFFQAVSNRANDEISKGADGGEAYGAALDWALKEVGAKE